MRTFFNRIFGHAVTFIIQQYLSFYFTNRFKIFRTLTSHNGTLEKECLMQNCCDLAFTAPLFAIRSLVPKREHCNHCFAIGEPPWRNLFIEITRICNRNAIFWATVSKQCLQSSLWTQITRLMPCLNCRFCSRKQQRCNTNIPNTYRLLHGWWARTIFIHELWRINNEWIKIVHANQPWSNLFII